VAAWLGLAIDHHDTGVGLGEQRIDEGHGRRPRAHDEIVVSITWRPSAPSGWGSQSGRGNIFANICLGKFLREQPRPGTALGQSSPGTKPTFADKGSGQSSPFSAILCEPVQRGP